MPKVSEVKGPTLQAPIPPTFLINSVVQTSNPSQFLAQSLENEIICNRGYVKTLKTLNEL